ncbi:MAG TPA: hypothetical protein PLO37_09395 [Candidatus Hydrogenedentes bacterium]|nr:hypothetical protein [Candidatus Hydrogenedentota bacterium]HPG67045.1 hypothetical protein [Candidatus Hydrogenedentota bacterium]
MADQERSILSEDDMRFLEDLTAAVVEASRVPPGAKVGDIGPNTTGGTLVRPGGRGCYPAFWIRDYAMALESGFITADEQRHALLLTADRQQDETWALRSGSVVPPGAVADHITFGGKPIFYPGTLEDYEGQGGPNWGKSPCLDDHFFFVHMAAVYVETTGDTAILEADVRGRPLIDRLEAAFRVPPAREDTGLVFAEPGDRGVNFGFFDTVTHTGDLLFCSVLRLRAARELAALLDRAGRAEDAAEYRRTAEALTSAMGRTFALDSGFLKASTGVSAQPDVWGTAFAVYEDALDAETRQAACAALAKAYEDGTIAWHGMIRHVPTSADFSATTAWERALAAKNRYQNGAYWPTPTGWVAYAIAQVNRVAARRLASELVQALREDDFRQGTDHGAPWECMHPEENHRQNPVYMTSVTCPLAAFRRLRDEPVGSTP